MLKYELVRKDLVKAPRLWLITGVAGFIGSNLLEQLLLLNQKVIGVDNFITGQENNLLEVRNSVSRSKWQNFKFIEGDCCDNKICERAVVGVDYVLHQAALGSVPRSLQDPISSNDVNIGGFLNVLLASRDAKVKSFIFAASSSTYGDHPGLPKVEAEIGKPLSPYAVTKYVNELYADVFAKAYGFRSIGLRYFNVFGPRQSPEGAYAAVIPKWIAALVRNEKVVIYGNGETSRDFCYVDNVVQANILAALANDDAKGEIYNVAVGDSTSLNDLYHEISSLLKLAGLDIEASLSYQDFRPGDVKHSEADIRKAVTKLGYSPSHTIRDGLEIAIPWYLRKLKNIGYSREDVKL